MSTTTRSAGSAGSANRRTTAAVRPDRGRLPAPRRDRRPALAALAVLLVLLGALGSALVAFRSGDRAEVLVAGEDIAVGQEITAADLTTARVAADGGATIPADAAANFVGSRATARIPAGTLLNREMFSALDVVPEGAQVVGLVVDLTRRTTEPPEAGDVVRLVAVSGAGEAAIRNVFPGDTVVAAARVTAVGDGGSSDATSLSVLVADKDAGQVAELASTGSLAVTVLPDATEPAVDLVVAED